MLVVHHVPTDPIAARGRLPLSTCCQKPIIDSETKVCSLLEHTEWTKPNALSPFIGGAIADGEQATLDGAHGFLHYPYSLGQSVKR